MVDNPAYGAETGKGDEIAGGISAKAIQHAGIYGGFCGGSTGNMGNNDFVLNDGHRKKYAPGTKYSGKYDCEFSDKRFVCGDIVAGSICERSHNIFDIAIRAFPVIRDEQ